jgi:hypothetical protein
MDARFAWSGVRDRVIAVVEAERRARGRPPSQQPVFEPVLTADEIAEVEAQYGVALPGEYRSFLAEVGAGGPGPGTLAPLRRVGGKWGWLDVETLLILDPSGPFIETQEEWADHQVATLRAAGHEPGTRDDEHDYLEDYRKAFGGGYGGYGEEAFFLQRVRGTIYISDNGCGTSSWLIVVGPHRGELRYRECAVNPPFDPLVNAHGNRHTFRTWYLEWLERREAQADPQRQRP